jgi:hypothetical protein
MSENKAIISAPQILFEYSMVMGTIKIIFIKVENIKTVMIIFNDRAYANINLTCLYDFAGELLRKASAKWEQQDANGYYPNPFRVMKEDKQAFEKLQKILNNLYFQGDNT